MKFFKEKKYISIVFIIMFIILIIIGIYLKDKHESDWFNKDLFSEISYEVPSQFGFDDEYTFERFYNYHDNHVYCDFNIDVTEPDEYDDFKEWFMGRVHFSLNDKVSDLKEISINGAQAYYVDKKSNSSVDYYYGIKSSNYYYLVTYSIDDYENGDRNDLDTNLCYNARDQIISTIQVK